MSAYKSNSPLTARLGKPYMYTESFGDSWSSAWLDDGRVLTLSCDTKGWREGCGADGSNWALNELTGDFTNAGGLYGRTVNPMKSHPFDFGRWANVKYDEDGVKRMWKANSIAFADGSLYVSVSRHGPMISGTDYLQDSINASIIRSDDFGETWSMTEDRCYFDPMFPGRRFPLPCFVQYYRGGGPVPAEGGLFASPHESGVYVYAVSNDGYWNNGNVIYLARIRRDRMHDMNADDWQYFYGSTGDNNDGCWSPDPALKTPILQNPRRLSMAGVQYIWPLRRYVMLQAYYPEPYSKTFDTSATCFEFYEAPAPWGPWSSFYRCDFNGPGYYTPEILLKSITPDGNGGCKMFLLTAGDWKTCGNAVTIYRMTAIELNLRPGAVS